jgi:hypothetical protein
MDDAADYGGGYDDGWKDPDEWARLRGWDWAWVPYDARDLAEDMLLTEDWGEYGVRAGGKTEYRARRLEQLADILRAEGCPNPTILYELRTLGVCPSNYIFLCWLAGYRYRITPVDGGAKTRAECSK